MSKAEKSTKTGEHKTPEKAQGPYQRGVDTSSTATRRDDHPAKAKERKHRQSLIDDQRIDGRETGTIGTSSFPKHSTASKDGKEK